MSAGRIRVLSLLVAVASLLSFAVSPSSAKSAKLAYGFKDGEDVAYSVRVLVEWPGENLTMTGYSIYHVNSANSVGYTSFAHSMKIAAPVNPQIPVKDRAPHRSFLGGCGFLIDQRGVPLKMDGMEDCPFVPAPETLFLPHMPQGDEKTWQGRRLFLGDLPRRNQPGGPSGAPPMPMFGSGGPLSGGGGPRTPQPERPKWEEVWDYSLDGAGGDLATIDATFNLNADAVRIEGKGSFVWSLVSGRVASLELKYRLIVQAGQREIIIPVTVTATLESSETAAKFVADFEQAQKDQAKAEEEKKAEEKAAAERAASQPSQEFSFRPNRKNNDKVRELSARELSVILIDLRSRDFFTVKNACDRLVNAKPTPGRRAQINKLLVAILKDKSDYSMSQDNAADALGVWGTMAEAPMLAEMLEHENNGITRDFLLGALKDIVERNEAGPPPPATAPAPVTAAASPTVAGASKPAASAPAAAVAAPPAPPPAPKPAGKIVYER